MHNPDRTLDSIFPKDDSLLPSNIRDLRKHGMYFDLHKRVHYFLTVSFISTVKFSLSMFSHPRVDQNRD